MRERKKNQKNSRVLHFIFNLISHYVISLSVDSIHTQDGIYNILFCTCVDH